MSIERLPPIVLGTTPSHAERARTLVEAAGQGTLSTLLPAEVGGGADVEANPLAGYPFGSIVSYAVDPDGHPLLLTSNLAEHTRNFKADARASLLVAETAPAPDVLALGRVTLVGTVEPAPEPAVRETYLQRHPESAAYADFKDFAFYRLRVADVRYVGGFGRMSWTDAAAYASARPDPTAAFASSVIKHMNEDHADALVLCCRHHAKLQDVVTAEMTALDCHGFEMNATTPRGGCHVRLGFPGRIATPDETRAMFMLMLKEARDT